MVRAGRRSDETVKFYETKAGHWIRILEGDPDAGTYKPFPLATLRAHTVDGYISARRAEDVSDHTIAKELVTLRAALRLAKRAGLWRGDLDEVLPVAFAPEYKPRERWLPVPEVQRLLAQLTADQAARVALIIATSACASEADHVLRDDVGADRVLLRGTKRPTRWRTVPLVTAWQRTLVVYATEHAGGAAYAAGHAALPAGRLFAAWGNIRRDLEAACTRAGIARCSPNDLRRTHSHWMRAEGLPLELLAPLMGHATTRMVQTVYGKLSTDELAARMRGCLPSASQPGPEQPCTNCITGASDGGAPGGFSAPAARAREKKTRGKKAEIVVPRDGIEPPTRGFSRPAEPRFSRRIGPFSRAPAAPVPQRPKIALVMPRWPAVEATKRRTSPSPWKPTSRPDRDVIPIVQPRRRRDQGDV
jgi:integrase